MTTHLPAIAIIGTGAMGGAILSGLLKPHVLVEGGIRVTNRTAAKARALEAPGVLSLATEENAQANQMAVDGASLVLIGVKPAMVTDVLREVAGSVSPDAVVVSVAAGITTEAMEAVVGQPVIRAMPNTPALVGRAVTGLSAGSRATPDDLALARSLFETVGSVIEIPESQINALGTISGSGPAYVFYFIEQLTATAMRMGFTDEQAAAMVNQTFLGAAELLVSTGRSPGDLRAAVTSPNGTTERAITELQRAELGQLFDRATTAALARTRELAAGG